MTRRPSVAIRPLRLNWLSVSDTVSRVDPMSGHLLVAILSDTSVPRLSSMP